MLDTDKREYMISKETISKSLNSDRLPIIDGNILLSSFRLNFAGDAELDAIISVT